MNDVEGSCRGCVFAGRVAEILIFCVWLVAGFQGATAQATKVTGVADADRRCQACHQRIYDRYLQTYMANASGPSGDRMSPGKFLHSLSGVQYSVETRAGAPSLSYERSKGTPAFTGTARLDTFLGSGHLGTTYLYSTKGYLFESPVAYYNTLHGYAMKPGLETERTMPAGLTLNDTCLRCHMSGVRKPDLGTENRYSGPAFLHTGITCESCHGSTDAHVASGGKAAVINPARLAAAERDSVCVVCHLEGDTRVERRGTSVLNYKPGEDIRRYMAYFSYAVDANTKRAVSEIEQFQASRCKRMSGAAMSCMTCHDVHAPPRESERATYYRAKCLTCHAGAKFASEHHVEQPDCTSCHMPKTGAVNVAHVAWTDHRIRRTVSAVERSRPDKMDGADLVSILEDGSDARDLGLGYYDLVTQGDSTRKAIARRLLSQAASEHPDDVPVLTALGVLAQMDRRYAEAEKDYAQVLSIEPANYAATTNVGLLKAAEGKVKEAETLWSKSFERNEDQGLLGRNLAIVQCMLGERDAAENTLRRVLIYGPDQPAILETLHSIETGQRDCSADGGTRSASQ